VPSLRQQSVALPSDARAALLALARLNDGNEVLAAARRELPSVPRITAALDDLDAIVARCGADAVSIDLLDLHGYRYHTGVTFAVHTADAPNAVLRGGRYDDIGKAFGRARPAVGFSIYLRELADLAEDSPPHAIRAPADDDIQLRALIGKLRAGGETVVQRLPGEKIETRGQGDDDFVFDRVITRRGDEWSVVAAHKAGREH